MSTIKLPTSNAIRKHWAKQLPFPWKSFDSKDEFLSERACFACGRNDVPLDRAHITARCEGGTDMVGNLHLLCRICHKDSEGIDGIRYWSWIEQRTFFDMVFSSALRDGSGVNVTSFITMALAVDPDNINDILSELDINAA